MQHRISWADGHHELASPGREDLSQRSRGRGRRQPWSFSRLKHLQKSATNNPVILHRDKPIAIYPWNDIGGNNERSHQGAI